MQTAQPLRRPWAEQGKKLRNARRLLHVSQERFAPTIGTTRRHLIRLENGEHKPGVELLGRIAEETRQSVESFGYPDEDDEESSELAAALYALVRQISRQEAVA